MEFGFSPEEELFRKTVSDFVDRECPREYVRELDQNRQYPYEVYEKMAKLGWFGLPIPEQYGGMGLDAMYLAIINEQLSRHSADIAFGYSLVMWGALNIVRHGSGEQKAYYLPRVMSGDMRLSFCLTEPDSGSDAASLTTSARLEGDQWVIRGQKVFATAAHTRNNVIIMAVRTDPTLPKHKGISLLLVPSDTAGVEMRRLNTLSRRIVGTNEIFLDDVKVPRENLLGEVNQGWKYVLQHLETERLCVAASYMGNAQMVVSDAVRYARERKQFGQPIGHFQAIGHMLADMQTEVDAARLLIYRVAWMLRQGTRCVREASMAKLFASETVVRVATNGMQIMGGYAQLPEYDMERYFRDAKNSTVGAGSSQIQRTIIARELGLV